MNLYRSNSLHCIVMPKAGKVRLGIVVCMAAVKVGGGNTNGKVCMNYEIDTRKSNWNFLGNVMWEIFGFSVERIGSADGDYQEFMKFHVW